MKKILVPVDFSDHTNVTAQYAIELAIANNAEIKLLHCYHDQFLIGAGAFPDTITTQAMMDVQMLMEVRILAETNMSLLLKTVTNMAISAGKTNLFILAELVAGDPDVEIKRVCTIYMPDIIIIGAVGKGEKNHFSGSTAERLIKNVQVPVLAIPVGSTFKGINNVLFATDMGSVEYEEIKDLLDLLEPYGSSVHFVHLHFESNDEISAPAIRNLKERLGFDKTISLVYFDIYQCTEPSSGFHEMVQQIKPELIVFQAYRRSFFYGWFKPALQAKDLYLANRPLLALPHRGD